MLGASIGLLLRANSLPMGRQICHPLEAWAAITFGLSGISGIPAVIIGVVALAKRTGNGRAAVVGIVTGSVIWGLTLVPLFASAVQGLLELLRR